MAHGALRIKEKLCNTPHLISPSHFETIITYLENKNFADSGYTTEDNGNKRGLYNVDTGVGFIDVQGALTYKSSGWEALCGGQSYESILEEMQEMVDEGITTVVMNVDSGGGEAYGMMETSRQLRKMADENNIKLIAYVDGMSASAAYGLSVAAHEIIVNPEAEVGSIGVVVRLLNDSGALKEAGYERTYVYAGNNKVPFNSDGQFREEFLTDIQAKVDSLYEGFTGFVADMRSLPQQAVKDTQASVFTAKDALTMGLVDKVFTRSEFFEYLANESETHKKGGSSMLHKFFNASKEKETAEMAQEKALQAQLTEMQEALASKSAEFETSIAELTAKYEQQIAALTADKEKAEAAAKDVEKKAEEQKQNARKQAITDVVGTERADELMSVVKGMDDTGFEVILKSLSVAAEKEAEEFKEKGVDGKAEQTVEAPSFAAHLPKKK